MYTGFHLLLADRFVHAACCLTCKSQSARGTTCVCCSYLTSCMKNQRWFRSGLFDSLMLLCYHFHDAAPLVNEAVLTSFLVLIGCLFICLFDWLVFVGFFLLLLLVGWLDFNSLCSFWWAKGRHQEGEWTATGTRMLLFGAMPAQAIPWTAILVCGSTVASVALGSFQPNRGKGWLESWVPAGPAKPSLFFIWYCSKALLSDQQI